MKLEQGQLWKKGEQYLRIVKWARLEIEYNELDHILAERGTRHTVSKKEFCRLLKGATLVTPGMIDDEILGADESIIEEAAGTESPGNPE